MTRSALLLAALLASGCGSDTPTYGAKPTSGTYTAPADDKTTDETTATEPADEDLLGSWTYTTFIDPEQVAELSDDPIPAGMEIDLSVEGSTTFHRGGRYDGDATVVLRVRQGGEEVSVRMLRREVGEWQILDGVLVQVAGGGTLTALDDLSQAVLDESPDFAAFLSPLEGETESTTIESVTEDTIDLQEQTSGLRYTLQRN